MTVRLKGLEPALPGLMSLTRTVPAAVPSLFHSSRAVVAVVGDEEERPAEVRQVFRVGAAVAGVDVLDEGGARGRAVGLPQLASVVAVARGEEDRVADLRELSRE